jgi:hypothetical protein
MNWIVPRIWEGGDVWIIGGGPSVPRQFGVPEAIINDVVSGKSTPAAYSPYMEPIHGKHVIGVNVAYLIGDWIDMVFFGDSKFYVMYKKQLARFPGLKVSCDSACSKCAWIKFLERDNKHSHGISPNPGKVSWNLNSGSAAISVAANAGAKRIILLGFDMTLGQDGVQHWHTIYQKANMNTTPSPKKGIPPRARLPFNKHLPGFAVIASDAKSRGIEILNASPNSVIQEFQKFTVKELLFDNT